MSQEDQPALCDQLKSILGEKLIDCQGDGWEITIEVASADWLEVAKQLRDEAVLSFSQLIDLCGVDYLGYGDTEWNTDSASSEGFSRATQGNGPGRFGWENRPSVEMERRFAVVAHLLSIKFNTRLRMRCFCLETHAPVVPSLVDVWASANWFEREAFDLLGVLFEGHPDLRRILTDYGFVGHPLRKDFPLSGNVEMRYDEDEGRVIYEPVSIEPRVLVPRVIRHDSRYAQSENGGEKGDG